MKKQIILMITISILVLVVVCCKLNEEDNTPSSKASREGSFEINEINIEDTVEMIEEESLYSVSFLNDDGLGTDAIVFEINEKEETEQSEETVDLQSIDIQNIYINKSYSILLSPDFLYEDKNIYNVNVTRYTINLTGSKGDKICDLDAMEDGLKSVHEAIVIEGGELNFILKIDDNATSERSVVVTVEGEYNGEKFEINSDPVVLYKQLSIKVGKSIISDSNIATKLFKELKTIAKTSITSGTVKSNIAGQQSVFDVQYLTGITSSNVTQRNIFGIELKPFTLVGNYPKDMKLKLNLKNKNRLNASHVLNGNEEFLEGGNYNTKKKYITDQEYAYNLNVDDSNTVSGLIIYGHVSRDGNGNCPFEISFVLDDTEVEVKDLPKFELKFIDRLR